MQNTRPSRRERLMAKCRQFSEKYLVPDPDDGTDRKINLKDSIEAVLNANPNVTCWSLQGYFIRIGILNPMTEAEEIEMAKLLGMQRSDIRFRITPRSRIVLQ
jgi:hypothetical protein